MEKLQQKRRYHWINKEIEKCDPETDYETIWRIATSYHLNDFMNHMIYSLTFPNFIVSLAGAEVVWRKDGGKVAGRAISRVEETENNNAIWWWYGPSDTRTQKSIEEINKLHAFWAKKYPGRFANNDEYIYTLVFSGVLMHRLRLKLGLSGFSPKVKIAAHHFWRDMADHFVAEGGIPLYGYPKDWDAMIEYCEAYENTPRPENERGHMIAEAIYGGFAYRYFPPALRGLGRAIPVALSLPTTLKALKVQPVNPILATIITWVVGTLMWLAEILLPDPTEAFWPQMEGMTPEQRRSRKKMLKNQDAGYALWFASEHMANGAYGCPYKPAFNEEMHSAWSYQKHLAS